MPRTIPARTVETRSALETTGAMHLLPIAGRRVERSIVDGLRIFEIRTTPQGIGDEP